MLPNDLSGKKVFIAGIADDNGYGWAIAKALAEAGATLILGTWVPVYKIFMQSLERGKFDESRLLKNGQLMEFAKVYPLDASFDKKEDVPVEILENKRYHEFNAFTISEVASQVQKDFGTIDILIHSLANAPEVTKPLLETSRQGYLAAHSASSYSLISLVQHFGPFMSKGGSVLSLSYIAAERVIPGYGGGMSTAKAGLESDTKMLAWEAGRKWDVRVNVISAGPLASRAAKAIGFIEKMIDYSEHNAPLKRHLSAEDIGHTAVFLSSSMAAGITGTTVYVDNGLHAMGVGIDSPCFAG